MAGPLEKGSLRTGGGSEVKVRRGPEEKNFEKKFPCDMSLEVWLKVISVLWGSFGAMYAGVPRMPPQTPSPAHCWLPSPEPGRWGWGKSKRGSDDPYSARTFFSSPPAPGMQCIGGDQGGEC